MSVRFCNLKMKESEESIAIRSLSGKRICVEENIIGFMDDVQAFARDLIGKKYRSRLIPSLPLYERLRWQFFMYKRMLRKNYGLKRRFAWANKKDLLRYQNIISAIEFFGILIMEPNRLSKSAHMIVPKTKEEKTSFNFGFVCETCSGRLKSVRYNHKINRFELLFRKK